VLYPIETTRCIAVSSGRAQAKILESRSPHVRAPACRVITSSYYLRLKRWSPSLRPNFVQARVFITR